MPDDMHRSGGGPFDPRHRPHHGPNGRRNGSNGSRPSGMKAQPVAFEELAEPVDLVAVQADDELINALAAGMSVSAPGIGGYDADDRVAAILAAWKADVDAEPLPELVDLDTAVSTVLAARPPSRRARHLAPVAAAAAFLVLAIGGVSVTSYNADPDDPLWAVSKVLYSERAESVEAAARVEDHIAAAKAALAVGEPVRAAQELARAEADLATVRPQEGYDELAEAQDFLADKAAETPQGKPVNPAAPLTTEPSRRVPDTVRESQSPSPDGESSATVAPPPSAVDEGDRGPEVAAVPDSGTPPRDSADVRRAPAPEPASPSATGPAPAPDGNGEGKPDPQTGSPSATPEGKPDPTTTTTAPAPASSGDGSTGEAGSTGPSASGDEPPATSN